MVCRYVINASLKLQLFRFFFFNLIIFFIEATKKKTEGRGASSKLISRSIRRSEYIKGVCVCVCVFYYHYSFMTN